MANAVFSLIRTAVYLDGSTLVNQVKSVTHPEIEWDTSELEAIGSIGVAEYARRMPAIRLGINTSGYSPKLIKAAANPTRAFTINVREAIAEYIGGTQTRTLSRNSIYRGRFLKLNLGETTQADETESETELAIDYMKVEFAGELILELARDANIYRTADFDYGAAIREILGE